MLKQARSIFTDIIRPHSYDHFFDEVVGRRPLALLGGEVPDRALILGPDPEKVILSAYAKHAPTLTCHALAPKVKPPTPRAVANEDEYRALIREYHESGFTVRIPDMVDLSPKLLQLSRALEVILEKPVGAVIFWSAAGADAPVHHDEIDVIALQLVGKKRWFISKNPPKLPNQWKSAGESPPTLDQYDTIDVVPGDLLYMPRGTAHTVQSTTDSIHISIGFVPVTLRDAMVAALDHLSDLDRPLRAGVTKRADDLSHGKANQYVAEQVKNGLGKLMASSEDATFVNNAMARRRARLIADLPKLPASATGQTLDLQSRIQHSPLAMSHIIKTPENLDFSQPGEQIFIHPGAEESLQYIVNTPEFTVADIPGKIGDDVRVALVNRLVISGFLQPATG